MSDKVFFDDSCYVCSLEISTIRKRGEACGIEFVDISAKDFANASEYEKEMIGEFDGKRTVGADTFRALYEKMGFVKTVGFTRLPLVKHLFNFAYWVFAYCIRPILPKKRDQS